MFWLPNVGILYYVFHNNEILLNYLQVYFVSLLANLNAREGLRARMENIHTHISVPLASMGQTTQVTNDSSEQSYQVCCILDQIVFVY